MSSPSNTLGAATEPSQEELDLMERSTKKQKGEGTFLPQRSLRSYKDSLVSPSNNWETHADFNMDNPLEEEDSDGECDIDDKYPTISLSKEEKLPSTCPTIIVPNIPTPITSENKSETEKDYGDWMLVTRKKFSKLKVQVNARSSNHRGAHRNQTTSTTTPGEAPAGKLFQNSKEQIHLDSHKDPPTAMGPTNLHITTETYQPVDSCPIQRQSPSKHSDTPKEVIEKHPEKNLNPVNLAHPSQNGTVLPRAKQPARNSTLTQKNVNLVSQPTVLEESTACNSSTRKTNTPHITQQTMCGPTAQPCMQPTDSPMDLDQKNHQTSTSLTSNHLQSIQTYNPYTHTQVNHSSSSHHGSTDSSISSPLLQEKSQDPTTTSSPNPNQYHATTPSRPHTLPKHLGNTHARETSPNRGQPGQLASPLPKSILDSSGRCHGESIEVPCTSVPPKHQLWPCGGEPHNRPCICLTNDGTHGRHSTPLESTESNHPNPSSDTRDPNWDRDHLRAERCRSPRKSDLHHLPRELPDIPSLSCQRSNHYSDRSTSTSFILPPVSGSHPQCPTTTPLIQGGAQPTTKELAGELSQPSPPEFSTAREEPGAGPSARNPQHIINEDPAMEL
ncbi:hypothetical protein FCV25MIE_14491 [Fagus crenata]